MKIHEFQAKEILRKAGVAVPRSIVARSPDEAAAAFTTLGGPIAVVKAQIHAGGRGKGTIKSNPAQHGVQLVKSAKQAGEVAGNLLGQALVTIQTGPGGRRSARCWSKKAATSPASCTWASSSIGRRPGPVLMVSSEGGMNIEEVAAHTPELIFREQFDVRCRTVDLPGPQAGRSSWGSRAQASARPKSSCSGLCRVFVAADCSLAGDQPAGRHRERAT